MAQASRFASAPSISRQQGGFGGDGMPPFYDIVKILISKGFLINLSR